MSEEMTTVQTLAWARAMVQSLDIAGDLFGRSHRFKHDARPVEIRIPPVPVGDDFRPIGRASETAALFGWQTENPTLETSRYHLFALEITIEMTEQPTVPVAIFDKPPIQMEIAGPDLAEELTDLVHGYEDRLAAAFQHWQQVARWISSSNALGSSQEMALSNADQLEFTRLIRADDRKAFWLAGGYASLGPATTLNKHLWYAIEDALSHDDSPPLWFRYLDDAFRNGVVRDLPGVVLSCAIACETLAREALWLSSGSTTNPDARDLIDRVPVSSILGRWQRLTGISRIDSRIREINGLFELRNKLMHVGGRGKALDEPAAEKFFEATRAFVLTGDEWYFRERGLTNPRSPVPLHPHSSVWAPLHRPRQ